MASDGERYYPENQCRVRQIYFAGDRADQAPLTWAQQTVWGAICRRIPHDWQLNFRWHYEIPRDRTLDDVCDAIKFTLGRFESLRTLYPIGSDGEPYQSVQQFGRIEVAVRQASLNEAESRARTLLNDLYEMPFKYAEELPIRFGIVMTNCRPFRPQYLVAVASHMSLDQGGVGALHEIFDSLLRGAGIPPDCEDAASVAQLTDRARYELSPRGRTESDKSIEYQEELLRIFPTTNFPHKIRGENRTNDLSASLSSPAVGWAAEMLAERYGTSSSVIFMASAACVIRSLSGESKCLLSAMFSNRLTDRDRKFVGVLSQGALVGIDLTGKDFENAVHQSMRASLRGYARARYNQRRFHFILREAESRQGRDAAVAFFNDVRDMRGQGRLSNSTREEDPGPLLERSSIVNLVPSERRNVRFHLTIRGTRICPNLTLTINPMYVPVENIDEVLTSIESLLFESAISGTA